MSLTSEIEAELVRATAQFPTWPSDPVHAAAVVGEEMGELTREVLQLTYEPHKSSLEAVRKEAVQLGAMAYRFLRSMDVYDFKPGEQHQQTLTEAPPPAAPDPAVIALQELIKRQHPEHPDVSVSVFTFDDHRVSEISVSWKHKDGEAGFSFMTDPECFAILFAAERYLMHFGDTPYRPEGWESDIDMAAEAEENFLHLYNKKS